MRKTTLTLLILLFSLEIVLGGVKEIIGACGPAGESCNCSDDEDSFFHDCHWPQSELRRIPAGETVDLTYLTFKTNIYGETIDAYSQSILQDVYLETVYTVGNQFIEFTGLQLGFEYQFSTCDRDQITQQGGITDSKFNTVLVLRDSNGVVISVNEDCSLDGSGNLICSYISYTHQDYYSQTVYLSIYVEELNNCDFTFSTPNRRTPVYYSSLSYCSVYDSLTCLYDSYSVYPNDESFNILDLFDFQTCSPDLLYYSVDNGNTFQKALGDSDLTIVAYYLSILDAEDACSEVGRYPIIFSLYDYNCTVDLIIENQLSEVLTFEDGFFQIAINNGLQPPPTTKYYYPAIMSSLTTDNCKFGAYQLCNINVFSNGAVAVPPIYASFGEDSSNHCGYNDLFFDVNLIGISGYEITEIGNDYRYALLGDLVSYDISVYLDKERTNLFETLQTTSVLCGIEMIFLELYSDYDGTVNFDGSILRYNTEYSIFFSYFIPNLYFPQPDFQENPDRKRGSLNNQNISPDDFAENFNPYLRPVGGTFENLYLIIMYTFVHEIDNFAQFRITIQDYIPPGQYEIVIYSSFGYPGNVFEMEDGYTNLYQPGFQSSSHFFSDPEAELERQKRKNNEDNENIKRSSGSLITGFYSFNNPQIQLVPENYNH